MIAAPERPEQAELIAPARIGRLLEVAAESYEIVVVDTSPFVNGAFLAALDQSDVLLIIATPEVTTLKDVRQCLEMLELIRFPQERIELVLNRSTAKVGITRGDVEAALGVRMCHTLPSTDVVPLTVNRGRPATLAEPRSDFARAARGIAGDLAVRRPIRVRSAVGREL
jgi:pilus assembly protein CpaE